LVKRLALVFGPGRDFGHEGAGRYGILVAYEVFGQEAVAFFTTTDVIHLAFQFAHHGGYPLEAGVAIEAGYPVGIGDGFDEFGGDNGLDHVFVALELAGFPPAGDEVVNKEQGSLVAVDQDPFTPVVLNSHTHAVGIRVGSHDDVSIGFLGLFDGHIEGGRFFRVGRDYSGKITAHHVLFRYRDDVRKTEGLQTGGNDAHPGAVDGGVDNLEVGLLFDGPG